MPCPTTELSCGLPQFISEVCFHLFSVTWQGWLLFTRGLFHLQLLTVMRRKPGQSISNMLLLQPLPDLSLLWSTQGKAHVCIAPGLFLTAAFICSLYETPVKAFSLLVVTRSRCFPAFRWKAPLSVLGDGAKSISWFFCHSETGSTGLGFTDRSLIQPWGREETAQP